MDRRFNANLFWLPQSGGASTQGSRFTIGSGWVPIASAPFGIEGSSTRATWTGHSMLVTGISSGTDEKIKILEYEPNADVWTSLCVKGSPSWRNRFTAVWTGDSLIIWGRNKLDGSYFNDGYIFHPF